MSFAQELLRLWDLRLDRSFDSLILVGNLNMIRGACKRLTLEFRHSSSTTTHKDSGLVVEVGCFQLALA